MYVIEGDQQIKRPIFIVRLKESWSEARGRFHAWSAHTSRQWIIYGHP
jgi:hypothetical protein